MLRVGLIQVLALNGHFSVSRTRTALVISTSVAVILAVGYGSAVASRNSCLDETHQDLERRNVVGTDMAGNRIPILRKDLSAKVVGPFVVEVSYLVPGDFHGSMHYDRYVVLLSLRHPISHDIIHLVGAPTSNNTGLSANNSFKPKPLRGSA